MKVPPFYESGTSNGGINHGIIIVILLNSIIINLENVSVGDSSLLQHGINCIHTDFQLLLLTSCGEVNIHKSDSMGSEGQDLEN